jgi:cobaltochelatase CobN
MLRITYFTIIESDLLPLNKAIGFINDKWGNIVDINLILPDTSMNPDLMSTAREKAKKSHLIILHLHGGETSFPYYDEFIEMAKENNVDTCIFDYGYEPRPDLVKSSTIEFEGYRNVFKYIAFSGEKNYKNLLLYLLSYYKIKEVEYREPEKPPQFGIYHPRLNHLPTLQEYMEEFCDPDKLTVGILFYQRDWVTKNLDFVDRIIEGIEKTGANALACFEAVESSTEDSKHDMAWFFENYFMLNGKAVISSMLSLLFFSLCSIQGNNPTYVEDMERDNDENFKRTWFLRKLNVPFIKVVNTLNNFSEWKESKLGLNPLDIMWSVALPEFDGAIITVPVCSRESSEFDPKTGLRVARYAPIPERTDKAIRLAINWGKLSSIANKDKKVAIIFHNYPPRNDQIASAFGLDSTQSVADLMKVMKNKGYKFDYIPETGDELIDKILKCATNDLRWNSEEEILEKAVDTISSKDAKDFFKYIPDKNRLAMEKDWGKTPGKVMVLEEKMLIPGVIDGNIFIGLQPRRGFLDDPAKIYHDPDMTPPWQYLGYYRWIRDVFKADAVMHIGKHGSLEWLPGKAIGLSENCYPDLAIMDLPNIYPYIINNPSEGTQAKRRSYACIIDHLIPVMNNADSYGEMEELEVLLDDYYHVKTQDPKKLTAQQKVIWDKTKAAKLDTDLKITQKEAFADFNKFLEKLHGYISEMKDTLIRDGLHIMGRPPVEKPLREMFASLTRLANGSVPSIRASIAELLGMDYDDLLENRGRLNEKSGKPNAVLLDEINIKISKLMDEYDEKGYNSQNAEQIMEKVFNKKSSDLKKVLIYIGETLAEKLARTTEEFDACMRALNGGYTPPGPSGAPTRGCADILPTGRNFYSIDPQGVPSRAAYKVGKKLADGLIERFVEEEGHYPESIGMVIWGGGVMRTKGDDIAEIFNLIGVRPEWEDKSGRVVGFDIIPLEELGRPRIDFTIREGGLRDAFPNIIYLINNAVEAVIELDEPDDMNFVRKHFKKTYDECIKKKILPDESKEMASARVFGSKPGTYGAGVSDLIDAQNWENDEDIANVYVTWGAYAYSEKSYGKFIPEVFRERLSQMEIVVKNEDTREYDFLDGDDFYSYHGGMIASVRAITGKDPHAYSCDTSDPDRIQVRTIQEEAKHIFRARILNPKWIESMKRHGFKGAGDFSRMVDIAFGWDATGHALEDWMYEALANTYALDKDMQDFFKEHNPYALHNIAERLLEAIEREMWNTSEEMKDNLREIMMEVEGDLEE